MLVQPGEGKERHIVQFGSTALSKAQHNYSIVELEPLGVQWALDICSFFVQGARDVTAFNDLTALL